MLWECKKIGPSILCWWKYKLVQPLGKSITEGKKNNQKTYVKSCHSAQRPLVAPFQSVKSNHVLAVGYLDPTASPISPSMTAWLTGLHHIAPSPLTHTPSHAPTSQTGPWSSIPSSWNNSSLSDFLQVTAQMLPSTEAYPDSPLFKTTNTQIP